MQVHDLGVVKEDNLESVLLPKVKGCVFHVTTHEGYEGILKDGFIGSNRNGEYPVTCSQSDVSYFRKRGCVSVVDLRDISGENLESGLRKYYFPNIFPSNKSVFLILKSECYPDIIPSSISKEDEGLAAMIVVEFEAGIKGSIPLNRIEGVIFVEVAVKPTPFIDALPHM
jgi:hypothetical protein